MKKLNKKESMANVVIELEPVFELFPVQTLHGDFFVMVSLSLDLVTTTARFEGLVLLHNGGSCNACTIKRSITLLRIPKQNT
jgi:hypothetical protein